MTPEEKQLLERVAVLSEENNHILRGIRRANRFGVVWKILYWAVVIALSYGAYIYIQPYFDQLLKMYDQVKGTADTLTGAVSQLPKF